MAAPAETPRDAEGELGARAAAVVAVAVVLVATAWLFVPLVLGWLRGAPRFFEWDVAEQYWPDLVYVCRSLHAGSLPAWNPYDRGGYPFYADPQAASYHPLVWGICAVAGASPSLDWQTARVIVGFACAGLFSLLWLRRLGVSWGAATVGAVVVLGAPFMRHNLELNLTAAMGWLPMVLWSVERLLARRTLADAALLALAAGLVVWSGSPPAAWLAGTFTSVYVVARAVELARSEGRAALGTVFPLLALAAVVAAGLSAVVIVPGLALAPTTVQQGRTFESIAEGGLPLRALVALVAPEDGNHLYVGWVALALAPLAFFRRTPLPGRFVLVALAVLGVVLALGDHTHLYRVAYDLVPGVRMFRLPHRYEAWLGPAMGALAAGGFEALRERIGTKGGSLHGRSTAVSVVLALVTVADVSQRLAPDRHTRALPAPGDAATVARILPRAPRTDVDDRYMDEFGIGCRSGTRLARRDFRGYQDPLMLASYERVVAALADRPMLAAQFNVRYLLTSPHFLHGWDHHYLPRPEVLARLPRVVDRGEGVFELRDALPFAYFVAAPEVAHVGARREDALAAVLAVAPAPVAFLEDGHVAPAARPPGRVVPASVAAFEPDALRIDVVADAPGVLVVNEAFHPGWRAWVDGDETVVYRANGFVRAVPLGRGAHVVEMRFEPPGLRALRALWLGSWVTLFALFATARRAARARARTVTL